MTLEDPNDRRLFEADGMTVSLFTRELQDYETWKGTIRFAPSKPLPASLIRRIVKARMAAISPNPARKGS